MRKTTITLAIIFVTIILVTFGQKDNHSKIDSCFRISTLLSSNSGTKLLASNLCEIKNFEFKLFNKWGEVVYSATSMANLQDFDISEKIKIKNKEKEKYPDGIYFWLVEYSVTIEDKLIEKKAKGNLKIKH